MLRTFSFILISLWLASAPQVTLSEDQPRTPETACVHFEDKIIQEDGTSFYDFPVLYDAIQRRNVSLALCLIREGAPVDESGYNDWTPLSRASQYGLLEVVEALLETGADAMRRDALGRIPYDYATELYWKYSSGDYPIGYLGTDPESRILEYREIVKALHAAQMRGKR